MKQQWKLTLTYDGTLFHGWQVQPGLRTVQGTLAEIIRQVLGEQVSPQGSGRTDAGVHALAQVVSFGLNSSIPAANLERALNRALPPSIRVVSAAQVDPTFHARCSATAKTYEYRIFQRRRYPKSGGVVAEHVCSPFLAPFVWDCRWPLRLERMRDAAACICGTHDFRSFAASDPDLSARESEDTREHSEKSTMRTIFESSWFTDADLLIYRVRGNGFLHHMVRNLVGTFVDVGRGSLEPEDIARILQARDRSAAGPTAPAQGLFLRSVEYDERCDRASHTS